MKICIHIGNNNIDGFWYNINKEFKDVYGIDCCFISDHNEVALHLNSLGVEAYSLDVDNNGKIEDAIAILSHNKYKDFNEIVFTEKVLYRYKEADVIKKGIKWVISAKEIKNKLIDVDVFFDFAGDEVGHNVFDLIRYWCGSRMIKYRESLYPDRMIFTENEYSYWDFCDKENKYDKNVDDYVDNFIEIYFKKKQVFWGDPKDRDYKLNIDISKVIENVFRFDKWSGLKYMIVRLINKRFAELFYDDLLNINEDKIVFYFPLHYPLDSQLTFRGRPFLNQIEFVLTISNFLPHNSQLIVKEHPHARGAVSLRDLKKIKNKNNILLLHPWESSYDIMDRCDVVLVINSTVALEALYKNKQVVSFGKNYLIGHDLVCEIKDFYDLFKLYGIEKKNMVLNIKEFLIKAYHNSYDLEVFSLLRQEEVAIKRFPEIFVSYLKGDA